MGSNKISREEQLLEWCASVLGPFKVVSDHSKSHPGDLSATYRLCTASGYCYTKTHRGPSYWETEVHAYEQWTAAFGDFAPKLLAVRDEEPQALVVGELPGTCLEDTPLPAAQERAVWHAAGQALAAFHDLGPGEYFGPCRRDGTPAVKPIYDAGQHVLAYLEERVDRGVRMDYLSDEERAIVRAARELVPSFEGELPVPCHRDYGPANWLVTCDGMWTGVADFEFAHWDVRVADFARYPDWEWIHRPDLVDAFFEGYGRSLTAEEEQQRLVAHVQYALTAVVWGCDNSYHGFAEDGRQAFKHLGKLLR